MLVINHKRIWVFDVGQKRDEGTTTAGKKGKHVTPASPASVTFIPRPEYRKSLAQLFFLVHKNRALFWFTQDEQAAILTLQMPH